MNAYTRHEEHRLQPLLSDLEEMFHAVIPLYKDGIFVIVDALDECQVSDNVRSKFIKALLRLQSGGTYISLLATSRPVPDIVEAFNGHSRFEIGAQKDDIELYMRNQIPICALSQSTRASNTRSFVVLPASQMACKL